MMLSTHRSNALHLWPLSNTHTHSTGLRFLLISLGVCVIISVIKPVHTAHSQSAFQESMATGFLLGFSVSSVTFSSSHSQVFLVSLSLQRNLHQPFPFYRRSPLFFFVLLWKTYVCCVLHILFVVVIGIGASIHTATVASVCYFTAICDVSRSIT